MSVAAENTKMELTERQKYVLYKITTGIRDEGVKEITLGGYAGTGKAQPLHSLIATPSGFVQMGDVQIGQEICTPKGRTSKITGIFPQGEKEIYRVWFSDGHSVECCDDHLWKVIDRRRLSNLDKYKSAEKVFPLRYIREFLKRKDGPNRFYIPTSDPVDFSYQPITVDPYLLGVLLGDGSIGDNNFAVHNEDDEILNKCKQALLKWHCHLDFKVGVTYDIVGIGRGPDSTSVELRNTMRKLELWNTVCETKFIPHHYLQNSLEVRWAVLHGLMDTDGTVDKRSGMASITTTSPRLAADICYLVESLGGLCRISPKKPKCRYKGQIVLGNDAWVLNIGFNNTSDLFLLKKKKEICKPRSKYKTQRCIRAIEPLGKEQAQCIMIDDPDHLYLTDHFVPTHNTTLIRYLPHFFPGFATCAYTGKAANVMRKKGMEAQTIHSLIYRPYYENNQLVGFERIPPCDFLHKGIIVDEASMVSEDIYKDLISYNLPTLFVGDHGQLEPIGSDFNMMKKPMYRLEEIHRNAGDIAKFAERLRFGYKSTSFQGSDKVVFRSQRKLDADDYCEVDQVICAFNKTRCDINKKVRANLGYKGTLCEGERVICLKNNKTLGLFNGMQGIVRRLYEDDRTGRKLMDFEFDNTLFAGIWYDHTQFGKERPDFEIDSRDYPNPFDYAYCITAHKSQGDEFDKVCVIEQKCEHWDHKRWAYTVASRAKESVLWGF